MTTMISTSAEPCMPRLSVVVPAFNEEENIIPLAEEIIAALGQLPGGFELILVDDKSTDSSAQVIQNFMHLYRLGLSGHGFATQAAFRMA